MNNSEFFNYPVRNDGCTSRGACSLPPSIASLQELLLYIIKQVSYYTLALTKFDLNNDKITKTVVNSLSSLVLINELNDKHLYSLIMKNYYAFVNAKETYTAICDRKSIEADILPYDVDFDDNSGIVSAISAGESLLKCAYSNKNIELKNNVRILLIVIKSVCSNISKLYNFGLDCKSVCDMVFAALNLLNGQNIKISDIQKYTRLLASNDIELNLRLAAQIKTNFGEITKISLSHSSRKGKAILVSGNNFFDLLNVLELTKDKGIDVYTHSGLLISHSLKKFRQYDNLVGHYGNSSEDCIVDFATFPGSILLTKNSQNNTEFLYRGKIFSNDYNIPQGVTEITDSDYAPLLEAALLSKGFSKGKILPSSPLGIDENDYYALISDISDKIINGEIEHLYIIIGNTFSEAEKEYYRVFLNSIDKDEFVLSFSFGVDSDNVKVINLGNCNPLIIDFLSKFLKYSVPNDKITYMFSSCSAAIISGIIYLKGIGAKDVYLPACSPRLINPSVLATFNKVYKVNKTTFSSDNLNSIRRFYQ